MTRALVAGAILAVIVLAVAWLGRVSEGRRALAETDAAVARADWPEAIMAARAAAEARCPASCVSELGYARLYAIAKDAEARADDATALSAWQAVRAAALGTAALDVRTARRERADAELARLGQRLDRAAAAAGSPSSPAASEERLRAALAASSVPSGAVFLLLSAGGALFLAGAYRFASARGRFARVDLAIAAAGAAVAAAGVLLF